MLRIFQEHGAGKAEKLHQKPCGNLDKAECRLIDFRVQLLRSIPFRQLCVPPLAMGTPVRTSHTAKVRHSPCLVEFSVARHV